MSTAVLADPQARVLEAVKKVSSIATLPEVTAKIISTVEDPKSTASQLHKIVSHDPALVTRIMKVVNSAFYGLPGQIGSIERAIVLLGLNAVKNLAVAASLGQMFRGGKLCDGFTPKDLWRHCIAVGVAARELARQMKVPVADEAFLAGMIASEPRKREELEHQTQPLLAFLTPFFFVVTGAKIDVGVFASGAALWMLAVVTVIAVISKLAGGFLGALSLGRRGATIVGVGMVPRGEVGVVIASLGLTGGVFSNEIYAVIVAMSLLTSVITPPVLAVLLRRDRQD